MPARIFFVHSGNETFVRLDHELLSQSFVVDDFYASRKFPAEFPRFWRDVKNSDVVFCWFASWNSFWALVLAKLLGKPSVLVIGGYDLANLPEADYGHQRGGMEKYISRVAMRLADVLLPFSYYSQKEAAFNAGVKSEKMQMIYMGVPDSFGELPSKKERMVLTVGKVDRPNLLRKGLEPFVRAAAYLPDVQFVLIGAWADDAIDCLRSIATPNVVFAGRITDEDLLEYYRRASVYVQASLHEGFGLSVAEAMLAGCVPVVTKAGSLPEVVGDCGVFCESNFAEVIAMHVQSALYFSTKDRQMIRTRILKEFPMEKRGLALNQIVTDCGEMHGKE